MFREWICALGLYRRLPPYYHVYPEASLPQMTVVLERRPRHRGRASANISSGKKADEKKETTIDYSFGIDALKKTQTVPPPSPPPPRPPPPPPSNRMSLTVICHPTGSQHFFKERWLCSQANEYLPSDEADSRTVVASGCETLQGKVELPTVRSD